MLPPSSSSTPFYFYFKVLWGDGTKSAKAVLVKGMFFARNRV